MPMDMIHTSVPVFVFYHYLLLHYQKMPINAAKAETLILYMPQALGNVPCVRKDACSTYTKCARRMLQHIQHRQMHA